MFEYGVPRVIPHAAVQSLIRRDFDTPIPPETYANLRVKPHTAVRFLSVEIITPPRGGA